MGHFHVRHADEMWAVRREDLPWLTDPHEERVRWPDRETKDWANVADLIDSAVGLLPRAAVDEDGWTTLELPTEHLAGERSIIADWGRGVGVSPSADPGDSQLLNGRHRLWAAWRARPDALLLVRSCLLGDLHEDDPAIVEWSTKTLVQIRERILAGEISFDQSVPLNQRYLERIEALL